MAARLLTAINWKSSSVPTKTDWLSKMMEYFHIAELTGRIRGDMGALVLSPTCGFPMGIWLAVVYTLTAFVRELPGWLLFIGIFLPVTLLLLLLLSYLRVKLREVDQELYLIHNPTDAATIETYVKYYKQGSGKRKPRSS
ncbi:small leucine-rich protein 1 [Lacerta agilis]|uniref:small leucine-rich protein 1 n=1 Tax=Lacerta agilis TaxID=80427 RepID=UPI00141967BA|nr:small leucine-rich protein 1 [Lacerta agilis]